MKRDWSSGMEIRDVIESLRKQIYDLNSEVRDLHAKCDTLMWTVGQVHPVALRCVTTELYHQSTLEDPDGRKIDEAPATPKPCAATEADLGAPKLRRPAGNKRRPSGA